MDIILSYFSELSETQKLQFQQLEPLYKDWNAKINVISRKDIEQLYERHVLHSLAIAKFFKFHNNESFLDVGTGGGFPGIPLAIMFPDCRFTLIDSIGKKILVVNEIVKALKLKNVQAIHTNVNQWNKKYDYILSRAVCNFSEFVTLTFKNLKQPSRGGIIYLKGGDLTEELKPFQQKINIFSISEIFSEPFFETKKVVWLPSIIISGESL
jgi:16S rRNA (guanine527-N7)-methyltransferase